MTGRADRTSDAREYQEAIAQWHLAARTEVKKSSSLPSAMFDTRDPMLEARLAGSVEVMMRCLHKPEATALLEQTLDQESEIRVERVTLEELLELPAAIQEEHVKLDVESGLSAEYLSLLIDTCTTGDEATQTAARDLLLRDFSVEANADLHHATQAVFASIQSVLADGSSGDDTHERMAELCSAIAASVIVDHDFPQDNS